MRARPAHRARDAETEAHVGPPHHVGRETLVDAPGATALAQRRHRLLAHLVVVVLELQPVLTTVDRKIDELAARV
eukprot:4052691-Prymnesium_polylepis.1